MNDSYTHTIHENTWIEKYQERHISWDFSDYSVFLYSVTLLSSYHMPDTNAKYREQKREIRL